MDKQHSKLPRIFIDQNIGTNSALSLDENHAHYFRSVLRRQVGDQIRVFNGRDGEWLATLDALGKRNGVAKSLECIKTQPEAPKPLHLIFTPIKKQRLSLLIEKAVELGATDLHPVLTTRTENRKINAERIQAQIIEALEQCERMHKPRLYDLTEMKPTISHWKATSAINACIARQDALSIKDIKGDEHAFLIGPEGGFDENEIKFLTTQNTIQPISLGETVYRAETACIICLTQATSFA